MLLTRLAAENFRSFSTLDLDIQGIHAATVCGHTGAGKSAAVVDLLSWVWFGKVRSTRPDEFIKRGTDACWGLVEHLEAGSLYRTTRSRSIKTKAGKSDLQFEVQTATGWQPLTGNSIDDTERIIRQHLGADFDTLMSSSISPQDEADRFTNPPRIRVNGKDYQGSSARMMVLAQMVGVTLYERLRQAALAEIAAVEKEVKVLDGMVGAARAKLQGRETAQTALAAQEQVQAEAVSKLETLEGEKAELEQTIADLSAQINGKDSLAERLAADRAMLRQVNGFRTKIGETLTRHRAVLAQEAEITQAVAQVEKLTAALTTVTERRNATATEIASAAARQSALTEQVQSVRSQMESLRSRLAEAQAKLARRETLQADVQRLAAEQDTLDQAKARRQTVEALLTDLRTSLNTRKTLLTEKEKVTGRISGQRKVAQANLANVARRIAEHECRIGLLCEVPCREVPELAGACKLLKDANESKDALVGLRAEQGRFQAWTPAPDDAARLAEIESGLAQTAEVETKIEDLTTEKVCLDEQVAASEVAITALQRSQVDLANLDMVEQSAATLEADRQGLSAKHSAIRADLLDLENALKRLREDQAGLEERRVKLQADLEVATKLATLAPQVDAARVAIPGLEQEQAGIQRQIGSLLSRIETAEDSLDTLTGIESVLGERRQALERAMADHAAWTKEERDALAAIAQHKATLATLSEAEADLVAHEASAAALRSRLVTLKTLEGAYKAIPLTILENVAIPFIQDETNAVLTKIARNRMRVRLETQRSVKSRDALADTCDIIVTDEVGERSLESYSGGQRFQVALATRVALAKLQAKRSGVKIETFVMDEGFGTQDAESLQEIITALRSLQHEFPQLLVVSHVEALRETFPARVEVSGGPRDSKAEVVFA